jgi:hypothetical protein
MIRIIEESNGIRVFERIIFYLYICPTNIIVVFYLQWNCIEKYIALQKVPKYRGFALHLHQKMKHE